ncbi:YbaN family protein [Kaustia mangrovi]|uniref:YbaN family protein n=1 Tax=Kaustia mangrovi TaxID=2593653 RepID=A0A7S8C3T8_9HYPH|nr:YbaN family protein [Kaustia mangrovi]QPC42828.1 YbaN family protein [Kaustia mangrovi]
MPAGLNSPDRPGPLKPVRRTAWAVIDGGRQIGFLALGLAMLALGLLGVFLPLLPTTIFLILAAWFFGRSSPRLEAWMLDHPRFGPTLKAWRDEGAVPVRGKVAACLGMAAGYGLFWLSVRPGWLLACVVAVFMISCAAYVVTRPEPGA